MTINFNTNPYYDDFSRENKFYKILFRPGYAVQARELTQIQSILQSQIEAIGTNVFKNGSIVYGCQSAYTPGVYLKLKPSTLASTIKGLTVTGQTSGATGVVKLITGDNTAPVLHFATVTGSFEQGETLVVTGNNIQLEVSSDSPFTSNSYFFTIKEGIIYVSGHFVYCEEQVIVVSPTLIQNPSARIGLLVNESVVTSEDNPDLLDPALGSSNYFAPGADRYAIELVLKSFEYDSTVEGSDNISVNNFVDIANIRNGDVINIKVDSDYNKVEDAMAKRTFDESGDYTVKPFIAKAIKNIYNNDDQFTIQVSSGKAYVKGYAFETTNTTYISVNKARDYNTVSGFPIAADYAKYVTVNNLTGFFNPNTSIVIDLHSVAAISVSLTSASYNNTKIGAAKVRYVKRVGTNYNMYLYDIKVNTGHSLSEVKSFISVNVTNNTYTLNAKADYYNLNNNLVLNSTTDDSLLFPVAQKFVKTFKPGGSSDTVISASKTLTGVNFAPGTGTSSGTSVATLTLPTNEEFIGTGFLSADAIADRFYIAVTQSITGTPAIGEVLTPVSVEIVNPNTAIVKVTSQSTFTASIAFNYTLSSAQAKTKSLKISTLTINYDDTKNLSDYLSVINLNKVDVVSITSITDELEQNYTQAYTFNNGQRDDYYDYSTLTVKSNSQLPQLNSTTNTFITIEFKYFEHSGNSGFFSVDSYIDIPYENIQTYTTSSGTKIKLSDCLDFRYIRTDNTFVNPISVVPNSFISADYDYYLARYDKLVVSKDKSLKIISGIPADAPAIPDDNPDAMTIYTVYVPPYTVINDIKLNYVDNKRYTMRDIGKIDKRVGRLEYYTTLSFLEKIAQDQKIPSSVPGVERFKNGILVDPFAGAGVADVLNKDFTCAIDSENKLLRPAGITDSYTFYLDENNSKGVVQTGDLITPEYIEIPLVSQTKSTRTEYLLPYEVFEYIGRMTLSPSTDIWHDTINNPTVTVNLNGENDAFTVLTQDSAGLSPWFTKWNAWQSVWRGVTDVSVSTSVSTSVDTVTSVDEAGNLSSQSVATTSANTSASVTYGESFGRSGLQFSAAGKTITTNLGTKLVDSSLIPYIRSKPITFIAKRLKPNTRHYATFDDVDVSQYCYPAFYVEFATGITDNASSITFNGVTTPVLLQKSNRLYFIPEVQSTIFQIGDTITINIDGASSITRIITVVGAPTDIISNEAGDIVGVFIIPNDDNIRFNVGDRAFKLADSLDKRFITSSCLTKYLAQGLTNTAEQTILATKINTVSIDPLQEFRQESAGTVVRDTSNTTITAGNINYTSIPPVNTPATIPTIVEEDAGVVEQTLFCGQNAKSSGKQGIFHYRINLGVDVVGTTSITCSSGNIPDRFKLVYAGKELNSGFISKITNPNNSDYIKYDTDLKRLGYPGIASGSTGTYTFTFEKLANVQFADLYIDAPIKGTGWKFSVNCPVGNLDPTPGKGVAKVTQGLSSFNLFAGFEGWTGKPEASVLSQTADIRIGVQVTITNTSSASTTSTPSDGILRINNINVGTDKLTQNSGVSFGIEQSGTSKWISRGAYMYAAHHIYFDENVEWYTTDKRWSKDGKTRTKVIGTAPYNPLEGNKRYSPTWDNTLGNFPVDIPRGESRTFTVYIDKTKDGVAVGDLSVKIDATNSAGTKKASINDVTIKLNTTKLNAAKAGMDPLAQTFFVEEPEGVVVTSIDLWFAQKDLSSPVTVEIRPVVNGYPSSSEIVPYATVTVDSKDIVESSNLNISTGVNTPNLDEYTRFKFVTPAYLPPGQYAFVILGNSKSFRIYTAVLGEDDLITGQIVAQQPYIGSMFKSQNASTWTAEQLEDIMFRINIAEFATTTDTSAILKSFVPAEKTLYDVLYVDGEMLQFPGTASSFYYKSTSETGEIDTVFKPLQYGKNVATLKRKALIPDNFNSLTVKSDFSSNSTKVVPALDITRLSNVLIQNIINNDATGEDGYSGGNALARYMTRRVTLAPGFEAQDLKVYINAYCPEASSFKVYYKVNAPGTTDFDSQNKYVEMAITSVNGNTRNTFAEYFFENATNTCLPDGAKFNTFVIKIVMLSPNPAVVPMFKDLRVIATDDY